MDLFANHTDLDTVCEIPHTQTIENLVEDPCGVVEYPLRVARFSQVNSLCIAIPGPVELFYIGLKGLASGDQRKAVVTVYESRANLADHQKNREDLHVGFKQY